MTRANPRGPRFDFDPVIERTQKQLKRRIRSLMECDINNGQPPVDGQGLPAQADGAVAPHSTNQPTATCQDLMFNRLNTLGQFGGTPTENAR
ncbi:hypothetical protein V6N11_050941 [Hibiscus sabdariffa]|uniref:Uncharacterized protein n=1 Tax=Hibiscus sabdariffa TaxID=183260 RepID=A0ABR2R2D4_9ROSI